LTAGGIWIVFRYIALLWNPTDTTEVERARRLIHRVLNELHGWTRVFASPGLAVFVAGIRHGPSHAYALEDGVVLGTLFNQADTEAGRFDLSLSPAQITRIENTRGRELIEAYWGRYVAFLFDPSSHETRILRDPTGGMPCLLLESEACRLCCSRLEDAVQVVPQRFTVNWETVTTRLAVALFHSEHSGLKEVTELRAGECLCIPDSSHSRSISRSFYWDPIQTAHRKRLEDPSQASAELRRKTQMCVLAWASRYSSIVHYLSGGLDSAIVLACLRGEDIRTAVTALTYFSTGADSDERSYALAAATKAGVKLVERERSVDIDLRQIARSARTATPVSSYIRIEPSRCEAEIVERTGADGIFSGDGGDALFFRTPASSAAIDHIRDHGALSSSWKIAFNTAGLDNVSVWIVLRDMWRYGVRRKRPHSITEQRSDWGAITPEVIQHATRKGDFVHPWFQAVQSVGPGKLRQAFLLSFSPDFYDPFDPDLPERAAPLLSQPLIELCLGIPTWVLAPGPLDRMLARHAFAPELPPEILHRTTKGSLARHVKSMLEMNRAFLADLLLDGVLVARGLLDRRKLMSALSDTPTRDRYWAPQLFEYAGIESWVRSWTSPP
jgi:asparagine synthase (glutamine-hydrolysing)